MLLVDKTAGAAPPRQEMPARLAYTGRIALAVLLIHEARPDQDSVTAEKLRRVVVEHRPARPPAGPRGSPCATPPPATGTGSLLRPHDNTTLLSAAHDVYDWSHAVHALSRSCSRRSSRNFRHALP